MLRPFILVALIFGLALAGLATLNGILLALSIPLVVYLGLGLLSAPAPLDLSLTRAVTLLGEEGGDSAELSLHLTNHGPQLAELLVRQTLPPGLACVSGSLTVAAALSPGQSLALSCTLRGRRGDYSLPPVRLRAHETFGLFRSQARLSPPDETAFLLLPHYEPLHTPIAIWPRQTRVFAGYIPARVGGVGVDFYGVRDYQPGDALRHLNWRAIARHDRQLFSNEFEQERVADVGLILDARQRSVRLAGDEGMFEHGIAAVAALADAFLAAGNRVSLLVYGQFLDWTLPGYGKLQRQRILQALARAHVGDSQVFDRLENLPVRLFPPKSQLALVSPMLPDDVTQLTGLVAHGYSLLVISQDAVAFEAERLPASPARALATRVARIERRLLFRRLQQAGIHVENWDMHLPFAQLAASRLNRPIRPSYHLNL